MNCHNTVVNVKMNYCLVHSFWLMILWRTFFLVGDDALLWQPIFAFISCLNEVDEKSALMPTCLQLSLLQNQNPVSWYYANLAKSSNFISCLSLQENVICKNLDWFAMENWCVAIESTWEVSIDKTRWCVYSRVCVTWDSTFVRARAFSVKGEQTSFSAWLPTVC